MREVRLGWMFVEVMVAVVEADGVAVVRAVVRNDGVILGFNVESVEAAHLFLQRLLLGVRCELGFLCVQKF